jgi:chemotaxis protein methyltransferase CheR
VTPLDYEYLRKLLKERSGLDLSADKQYLVESRLLPLARRSNLAGIPELVQKMKGGGAEALTAEVVEAMTTNETYFFRDAVQYDVIRTTLLPRLKEERKATKTLRFWSAASSTGQEAYTLALLLIENGWQDWNIQILGTDFSAKVVERARSGFYQQIEVNRGMPAALLVKHFRRSGLEWQISEAARKMVRFDTIDLRKSMRTLGPFDLVFCRNVMIYFDNETKQSILREIHGTLHTGGWLLLGGAETVACPEDKFERKAFGNVTVYLAR